MDMRRLVGRNAKQARLACGLSQEVVAARSGRTQQYISGLENGGRNPTIIILFEIAQVLGVTPASLLTPQEPE
jgi:transcriptional regulator with XRE-family HTH domain